MSAIADGGQPSLRRMRRFGVRPDRDLGQNFLVDSNILGVIERAAELGGEDVVLEIGGGLGVLSEHLAERVGHVHVVEVDERLREPLLDATAAHPNVSVHWADAMALDLRGPAARRRTRWSRTSPTASRRRSCCGRSRSCRRVALWVAMTQKEVGERLAASPGSRAYGAPSVLAQLECEVRVLRAIPRTVFYPVPNVDSVLIEMRRARLLARAGCRAPACARSSRAHSPTGARRSPARSRSPARPGRAGSREDVRAALEQIGQPADARAERLSPQDFRGAGRNPCACEGRAANAARARSGEDQPRPVPRARPREPSRATSWSR